jgi:exopolysaccharide biosynthesis polyprenyl glycosylphosphotransferase
VTIAEHRPTTGDVPGGDGAAVGAGAGFGADQPIIVDPVTVPPAGAAGGALVVRTAPAPAGAGSTCRHRSPVSSGATPHRWASLLLGATTAALVAAGAAMWSAAVPGQWWPVTATAVAAMLAVLVARGQFRVRMIPDVTSRLPLVGAATAIAATAAVAVAATGLAGQPDAPAFVALLVTLASAATAAQVAGAQALRWMWRRGWLRSRALVLGSDELARELAVEIGLRREYGVDVVGFIAGPYERPGAPDRTLPAPTFAIGADLPSVFALAGADRLIIGPAIGYSDRDAVRVARWAAAEGFPVFVVPRFYEMGLGLDSMAPDRARGYPLVRLQRAAHPRVSLVVKRALDIAVAGSVLVAAAPVMVLAAVAVKVSSPGPVLFSQDRVGRHGRRIVVRKFRSMTVNTAGDSEWTAESRVTAVGALLRRSNIDELPQLWSIVRGEMSLVGPRPERPVFVERFRVEVPDYDERHRMPVGLTGLAQIIGLRGDTSIAERVKYDNLYIDQWSVGTDLQILAKTVIAVLRQGSYQRREEALETALRAPPLPEPPPSDRRRSTPAAGSSRQPASPDGRPSRPGATIEAA